MTSNIQLEGNDVEVVLQIHSDNFHDILFKEK